MSEVKLYVNGSKEISTIFHLLGVQENDISRAIIWVLRECPRVLDSFLKECCGISCNDDEVIIDYQHFEKVGEKRTYTDIEIYSNSFYLIFEAKRGWKLPSKEQIEIYSNRPRFFWSEIREKRVFTISECSEDYADKYLPIKKTTNGFDVSHISWKRFVKVCDSSVTGSRNREKYLIREFIHYIKEVMTMSTLDSNSVFVVALGKNEVCEGNTYIDVVYRAGKYYCPVKWFRNPNSLPNYIGFRYDAKLQSIHHIDGYIVTKNLHDCSGKLKVDTHPNLLDTCFLDCSGV